MFSKKAILEKIQPLIENTCMRFNLIPLEIDLTKENGKWFLRIFIYSSEHEISHQDCENVSRSLDTFLDELIPVKYALEISSPGLERKLKSIREYIIFSGKIVEIKLKDALADGEEKHFKARLINYVEPSSISIKRLSDEKEFLISLENIIFTKLCYKENEEQLNKEIKND